MDRRSLIALLIATLTAGGCKDKAAHGDGPVADKLVVGMELKNPPFQTFDDNGDPTGVSVDLAMALGEFLNREVEIRDQDFDGLLPALAKGHIDLIISSMTATAERSENTDFSEPYATIGLAMLVAKDSPIRSAEDLNRDGVTVVVKLGTTGEVYASKSLDKAKILKIKSPGMCLMEVAQGKADAFIYDQLTVLQFSDRHPDTTRAILDPIQIEHWAVGIKKGNAELRGQVNAFLKGFREAGGYERLTEKHLSAQKRRFEEAGVPFIF